MDIRITITGKVTIPEDDLHTVQNEGFEELATILHRYGKEIKTDVSVIEPGPKPEEPPATVGVKSESPQAEATETEEKPSTVKKAKKHTKRKKR